MEIMIFRRFPVVLWLKEDTKIVGVRNIALVSYSNHLSFHAQNDFLYFQSIGKVYTLELELSARSLRFFFAAAVVGAVGPAKGVAWLECNWKKVKWINEQLNAKLNKKLRLQNAELNGMKCVRNTVSFMLFHIKKNRGGLVYLKVGGSK